MLWLKENEPAGMPDVPMTPARLAMPEEYKDEDDPVASYRRYYFGDKQRFAVWEEGQTPSWWIEAQQSGMEAAKLWRPSEKIGSERAVEVVATKHTDDESSLEEEKVLRRRRTGGKRERVQQEAETTAETSPITSKESKRSRYSLRIRILRG